MMERTRHDRRPCRNKDKEYDAKNHTQKEIDCRTVSGTGLKKMPKNPIADQFTRKELEEMLNVRQQMFLREYVLTWESTKSYMKIYPEASRQTAAVNASRLLAMEKSKQYIKFIVKDYEFITGVNKARQISEFTKIAYTSIAHMHDNWTELKDFESLTEEQKSAIESIETKTETIQKIIDGQKEWVKVNYIKIKLYNKIAALEAINKLMGYNEAQKTETTVTLGTGSVDAIRQAFGMQVNIQNNIQK